MGRSLAGGCVHLNTRLAFIAFVFVLSNQRAFGSPITVSDGFYDLRFSVESSITLVPGETSYLKGRIDNAGSLPLSFKPYDSSNRIGGYGWDFNDPGFAIGAGAFGVTSAN